MSPIRIVAAASVALVLLQTAPRAGTLPPDVERFLAQSKFTIAEAASMEQGTVVARVAPGGDDTEVVTTAAVKIHATRLIRRPPRTDQARPAAGSVKFLIDAQLPRARAGALHRRDRTGLDPPDAALLGAHQHHDGRIFK